MVIDPDALAPAGSADRLLLDELDLTRLPRHVAVIMDGNGRWARQRGFPRVQGHRAGIASVREIVETCARLELDALTLYAFSVENWKRPRFEIVTLMSLLKEYLNKELANLLKNDIRFRVVGRMNELDPSVQKELSRGLAATSSAAGWTSTSRHYAAGHDPSRCSSLANDVAAGRMTPEQIDERRSVRLALAGPARPDLLSERPARSGLELSPQEDRHARSHTPTLGPTRKQHLFEEVLGFRSGSAATRSDRRGRARSRAGAG